VLDRAALADARAAGREAPGHPNRDAAERVLAEATDIRPQRDRRARHLRDRARGDRCRVGARKILRGNARVGVTVREFWNDWTTGTLWLRRSASNNRARTHKFVAEHGDVPLRAVGDKHVAAWLKGGRNRRDGACAARVLQRRGERARRSARRPQPVREARPARASRGRRDTQPPTQGEIARFIALADQLTPPSFAGYLDLAVYEGMRPGEIDALRWKKIDFQAGTIVGDEQ